MTFADLQNVQEDLIRKALAGSLFGAGYSADPIDKLTDETGELQTLPTGYADWGLMTDDGQQFTRAVDVSDVTSFGRYQPSRSDKNSDVDSLQVSLQETNIHTIALITEQDEADLIPDPASGELKIVKPERPSTLFYRLLAVGVDDYKGQEIYIARHLPRAKVNDYADSAFSKGDDPVLWGATFQGTPDPVLKTAKIDFFGGPGWKALLSAMGFITNVDPWAATTAYTVGDRVKLTTGEILIATASGTSDATEPVAPGSGQTVVDGSVAWQQV